MFQDNTFFFHLVNAFSTNHGDWLVASQVLVVSFGYTILTVNGVWMINPVKFMCPLKPKSLSKHQEPVVLVLQKIGWPTRLHMIN